MNGSEITYIGAALGGLISFLSPCVLPLVPAYLSFIAGASLDELTAEHERGSDLRGRVLLGALGFVLGFSTVFIALGAGASAINPLILQNKDILAKIAGVVIIVFGLHYMGAFRLAFLNREARLMPAVLPESWRGGQEAGSIRRFFGPYVLGLAFAFGWTPCIGPILAAILTVAASGETLGYGVSLLTAYSLGLGIPFLLAAYGVGAFMGFLARFRHHIPKVEFAAGLLLVFTGALIFTGWLELIANWMIKLFPFLAEIG